MRDALTLRRATRLAGRLSVPGDKSITHRALLLGLLARGTTRVRGANPGLDCAATLRAVAALGGSVVREGAEAWKLGGTAGRLLEPGHPLDLENSGTGLRLLLGTLAGSDVHAVLTGDASLRGRPMGRVVEPLREMGAAIDGREGGTRAPLSIRGGSLHGIERRLPTPSAQVKSALLLAGLRAEGETAVVEPLRSRDHTERMLPAFSASVREEPGGETGGPRVSVLGGQRLRGAAVDVPGDLSAAAFFVVAGALLPGSDLVIEGVGLNPTRTAFLEIARRMGAAIEAVPEEGGGPAEKTASAGEIRGSIRVRGGDLRGTTIAAAEVAAAIDEIPALAALAVYAAGSTTITGAGELRVKESDRIHALASGFAALGGRVEELEDGLVIHGAPALRGGAAECGGDHRIAMALAAAGLRAENPTRILGVSSIDTSYPGFAEDLARVAVWR